MGWKKRVRHGEGARLAGESGSGHGCGDVAQPEHRPGAAGASAGAAWRSDPTSASSFQLLLLLAAA